jgi:hypothetical protein
MRPAYPHKRDDAAGMHGMGGGAWEGGLVGGMAGGMRGGAWEGGLVGGMAGGMGMADKGYYNPQQDERGGPPQMSHVSLKLYPAMPSHNAGLHFEQRERGKGRVDVDVGREEADAKFLMVWLRPLSLVGWRSHPADEFICKRKWADADRRQNAGKETSEGANTWTNIHVGIHERKHAGTHARTHIHMNDGVCDSAVAKQSKSAQTQDPKP